MVLCIYGMTLPRYGRGTLWFWLGFVYIWYINLQKLTGIWYDFAYVWPRTSIVLVRFCVFMVYLTNLTKYI